MALVIFSVHHEDNSYSPMAVVKDNGVVISPNPRLKKVLSGYKNTENIEKDFNNGQSKVTGRFSEAKALDILEKARVSKNG